jgi:FeS assembly protein IscX
MRMRLDWHDAEEIALQLMVEHPDVDPLSVRFTDLRRWVCELPDFAGDPGGSNEGILEQIQMAWYEEFSDQ